MFRKFLDSERLVLIAGISICACVTSGCLESSFTIASESRLPKWITLPAGVERADVSLALSYYTTLWGDDVQIALKDKNKQTIERKSGKNRCVKPFQLANSGESLPSGFPNYAAVTVDGTTEILEQRRPDDVLYVTDDPIVWKQYRTVGCR